MIVNYQKKIEFVNTCECLIDYVDLEKAILWYQDRPTSRLKKIYVHGLYPCVTIHNKKIHTHRLLMMYWEKTKIIDGFVHHIDENKLNCLKCNLEIMEISKHQSLHNKGKQISEEHKEAIRRYNNKRWNNIHDKENSNEK